MIAYGLIVLGFIVRLLPHVPNTAPIAAIALFAGAYLNRKLVPWVPLAIMVITDLIIGVHDVALYTWGAFIVIGFIGMRLKENKTPGRVFTSTVFSAVLFFVISNFGVWFTWYPHTSEGFTRCFVNAIPFFRNTLFGNLVFAAVLFGSYEIAKRMVKEPKLRTVLLTE